VERGGAGGPSPNHERERDTPLSSSSCFIFEPLLSPYVPTQVGMRVASNRGASGIDGVVSTAAGFAAGLQVCARPN
jgi:hypothetical protein